MDPMNVYNETQMAVPKIQVDEMLDSVDYEPRGGSPSDDHLRNLKALTEKLRLETRRPSYLEWQAKLEELTWKSQPQPPWKEESGQDGQPMEDTLPATRMQVHMGESSAKQQAKLTSRKIRGFENIEEALNWLRKELVSRCVSSMQTFGLVWFFKEEKVTSAVAVSLGREPFFLPAFLSFSL